ncbi:MAG: lipoyl domain-containing protein [Anaerolineales bacterium]|nr:lipoyl domain-containing protein [Anaerolineales bacterium]
MDYEVVIPSTADGALAVRVRRWLAAPGQPVKQGRDLVEVTTEKIALYVAVPADGVLAEIRVPAGNTARVGLVIGLVRGE